MDRNRKSKEKGAGPSASGEERLAPRWTVASQAPLLCPGPGSPAGAPSRTL